MIPPASRIALLAAMLAGATPTARAETILVPVTLDYPLLRSLFASQAYTAPGETALVLDESNGCYRIELRDPEVGPEGPHLRLGTRIKMRMGIFISGECMSPVDWEGYVELAERPWIDKETWRLSFETVDSRLFNSERKPAEIASEIWNQVKTYVHPYFDRVGLSLAPPVQELKTLLPQFFPPGAREPVTRWLASIRPAMVRVAPDAVRANILMDVEPAPAAPPREEGTVPLSEEEAGEFVRTWETWDAFLVFQILSLGGVNLTDEESEDVLETLIETRTQFVQTLLDATPGRDLVREQFVRTWQRLGPIFRRHALEDKARSPLGYLPFFTASDALASLDQLGPTLGVEVSRDGLLRLAAYLAREGTAPALDYSFALDTALRKALGLGDPLPAEPGPIPAGDEVDLGDLEHPLGAAVIPARSSFLWRWVIGTAHAAPAAEAARPDLAELGAWLVPDGSPAPYVERLKGVLQEKAGKALEKGKLDPRHHAVYRLVVPATAWQESCWRQFVVKGGKLTYLRSYNNTSVGFMQINERVWRGVYEPASLRWNVPYNAAAGCEILEQYLSRFAVGKMNPQAPLSADTLARAAYAMYNGGPGQFEAFLKRAESSTYSLTDRLFAEKYAWVKSGEWSHLDTCLPGR